MSLSGQSSLERRGWLTRRRAVSAMVGFVWGVLVFLACRVLLEHRQQIVIGEARQAEIEQMALGLFVFLGFSVLMFVVGMVVAILGRSRMGFRGLLIGFVSGVVLASVSLIFVGGTA